MELYVHIPFCRRKCRYCDFVSFPGSDQQMTVYVEALLQEAANRIDDITEPIETVYFGGGTPSILSAHLLKKLIDGLKDLLPLENVKEWTSEANPGTVTAAWLETAQSCGINRLSLGVQAVQTRLLQSLGRIHTMENVYESFTMIRKTGFTNVNVDLIFGLPSQTLNEWRETLQKIILLSPEHISAYGLIPEEGTPLYEDLQAGRLSLPPVEQEREMYEILLRELTKNGFEQYEISNFSLPGYSCKHNIGYWTQVPYLGIGLSAASMIHPVYENGFSYQRRLNKKNLPEWLSGHYTDSLETISPSEARFETMMLGLRMNRGISETEFKKLHHVSLKSCYGNKLQSLADRNLIQYKKPFWSLTRQGMDLQNMVLVELMDE